MSRGGKGACVSASAMASVSALCLALGLTACAPLLATHSSVGLGAFWGVESSEQPGVLIEGYSGVGLVLHNHALLVGWIRLKRIEVDTDLVPSGSCRLNDVLYFWGEVERDANCGINNGLQHSQGVSDE